MADMTAAAGDALPRPHAVLHSSKVEALLSAVGSKDQDALDRLGSPAAFDLTLAPGWHISLHPLQASAADYAIAWNQYELLLVAAIESGALALPDGTEVDIEEIEPGRARLLIRPTAPLAVTLATDPFTVADIAASAAPDGDGAEHALLVDAAWRLGSALVELYAAALPLLADYSTDPNLLAAIADTNDAGIRAAALRNPHTPERARIMAALRTEV
jgi:hypothetical protein